MVTGHTGVSGSLGYSHGFDTVAVVFLLQSNSVDKHCGHVQASMAGMSQGDGQTTVGEQGKGKTAPLRKRDNLSVTAQAVQH